MIVSLIVKAIMVLAASALAMVLSIPTFHVYGAVIVSLATAPKVALYTGVFFGTPPATGLVWYRPSVRPERAPAVTRFDSGQVHLPEVTRVAP